MWGGCSGPSWCLMRRASTLRITQRARTKASARSGLTAEVSPTPPRCPAAKPGSGWGGPESGSDQREHEQTAESRGFRADGCWALLTLGGVRVRWAAAGPVLLEYDIATNAWAILDDGTVPGNPGTLSRGSAAYSGGCVFVLGGRLTSSNTEIAQSESEVRANALSARDTAPDSPWPPACVRACPQTRCSTSRWPTPLGRRWLRLASRARAWTTACP